MQAENAYDCYSPVREEGCCVQCQGFIKSYLPYNCRYGDKAGYCKGKYCGLSTCKYIGLALLHVKVHRLMLPSDLY